MSQTLKIIRREHRNLFALLSCFKAVVRDAEARQELPDFGLLIAIMDYLEGFLNRFHHPKESLHLFPVLRERSPSLEVVLSKLEHEHDEVGPMLVKLRGEVEACQRDGVAKLSSLRDAVERYARLEINHMAQEEDEILPAAWSHLKEADWKEIDAIFMDHDDPLFGDDKSRHYSSLYSKIVEKAPAPHGLGQG